MTFNARDMVNQTRQATSPQNGTRNNKEYALNEEDRSILDKINDQQLCGQACAATKPRQVAPQFNIEL